MAEIIPAILPKDFHELQEKLVAVAGSTSFVQIDVVDGKFAGKTASWPYYKPDVSWQKILKQEEGMPSWEDFDFEIDLMLSEPFSAASDWIQVGASRLVFHIESLSYNDDSLLLDQMKHEGLVEIGFAIGAHAELTELDPYLPFADFVQVMGIEPIGFQGIPFDRKAVEQVAKIRETYPHAIISVDGGMNAETAPVVVEAGADRVVVGSYIFGSTNPREAIRELEALL